MTYTYLHTMKCSGTRVTTLNRENYSRHVLYLFARTGRRRGRQQDMRANLGSGQAEKRCLLYLATASKERSLVSMTVKGEEFIE